jgi:hypothetical protein
MEKNIGEREGGEEEKHYEELEGKERKPWKI